MSRVAGLRSSLWLSLVALSLVVLPGAARADNCGDLRNNITTMDGQSNALPGYLGMRVQLAGIYNRLCGTSAAQRNEYWYTIDGKQLGPAYSGDRPPNAAYAATPDIAARCAGTSNPSMCAFALGAFANCKTPPSDIQGACAVGGYGDAGDTVASTGGDPLPDAKLTIGGKTYDVPNACAQALAQAGDGGRTTQVVRTCPDDLLAALGQAEGKDANTDPTSFLAGLGALLNKGFTAPGAAPKGGFDQAFCKQMQDNADECRRRENRMGSIGQQATGTTGQIGAFDDCSRLYGQFAGMCRMNVTQRPQIANASLPKGTAPSAAPTPTTAATAPPPAPPKPACPPGTTPTKDGYCLSAGQNYCGGGMACSAGMACRSNGRCFYANGCYPDQIRSADGCRTAGMVDCGGGLSCFPGEYCKPGGACGNPTPRTGPICGANGLRAPAGYVCDPYDGHPYNPATQKLCGTTLCDVRDECGNNGCLNPYHQTAVPRQGAGRVQ